jgi:8-oxo-dGTP diphosphatase
MSSVPKFNLAAFAVIFDMNDRVLLCQRQDMDLWNLPGGALESGELPDEAVVREVKEETGLEVAVERLVGIYGKQDRNEIIFVFECQILRGAPAISDEARAVEYFDIHHLPSNTIPKHVERIQDASLALCKPLIKRQTAMATRDFLGLIAGDK